MLHILDELRDYTNAQPLDSWVVSVRGRRLVVRITDLCPRSVPADDSGKMEVARDALLIVSDRRFQLKSDNGAYILTVSRDRRFDRPARHLYWNSGVLDCPLSIACDWDIYWDDIYSHRAIGNGSGLCNVRPTVISNVFIVRFVCDKLCYFCILYAIVSSQHL